MSDTTEPKPGPSVRVIIRDGRPTPEQERLADEFWREFIRMVLERTPRD